MKLPHRRGLRRAIALSLLFVGASAIASLLSGCASEPWRDLIHVQSGGARHPVVIYGASDASTLILFQHGGPGLPELDPLPASLRELAQDHLVASWAQRSTPLASGRSATERNTISQHIDDMHLVLGALKARYPQVRRVVLMGHSWGVSLTLGYLDRHGESGIDGVILAGGFDSFEPNARRSLARLAELSDARAQQSSSAADRARHERARDFARRTLDAGSPIPFDAILEASGYCDQLEVELDEPEALADPPARRLASVAAPVLLPDGSLTAWNLETIIDELTRHDLSLTLPQRRAPLLMIWGRADCRVPVQTAESMLQRYGATQRSLVIIEEGTHYPLFSQPTRVADATRGFVRALP